jgi:biopolymer transport protein ExbB
MLQDNTNTAPATDAAAAPAAAPVATNIQLSSPATSATTAQPEAVADFSVQNAMAHMGVVNWSVFVALVIMSLVSWYYTVMKAIKYKRINGRAGEVTSVFWQTTNAQEAIRFMETQPAWEPFSKIALDSAQAAAHHQKSEGRLSEALNRSEFIDRALRQAVARESASLEDGQTWLATTGAIAPFVGLLGTVWGILMALVRLSASGESSIKAVAGPVGEALIMTFIGLFVAIPAVIAFNTFNRNNRKLIGQFDAFAHDLHDFFATGARVGEKR